MTDDEADPVGLQQRGDGAALPQSVEQQLAPVLEAASQSLCEFLHELRAAVLCQGLAVRCAANRAMASRSLSLLRTAALLAVLPSSVGPIENPPPKFDMTFDVALRAEPLHF